jgi:hypothetical protein
MAAETQSNEENDVKDSTHGNNTNEPHKPLHAEQDEDLQEYPPSRIKDWLKNIFGGLSNSERGNRNQQLAHKKRLIAVSLLAVAILGILRHRRHRRQIAGDSSHNSTSLWPLGLLVEWWKGPEYKRNPKESTMSLLWAAARDGIIQQALIGSSTIFFQTKNGGSTDRIARTTQWNRATLPANNEAIRVGLVEALTRGGADVSAIPESIWAKLATPLLAALPFVYLALLYRMMKNQFGGEDISSKLTNGTRNLWGSEEKDRTTFADVAGLDPVIEDMSEVVSYLSNPSLYKTMGARPPRGVLLHGPPGSGSK